MSPMSLPDLFGGFVHLHVHSQYSFLDGASRCSELVARCAELGMGAMAQRTTTTSAAPWSSRAPPDGIKPIRRGAHHGGRRASPLLAENPEGYANICNILTDAYELV